MTNDSVLLKRDSKSGQWKPVTIHKHPYKKVDPGYLRKQFEDRAQSMFAEFQRIKRDGIGNKTDEGSELEGIFRRVLSDYLPKKFGIDNGYVINSHGEVSNQQDVVIYDSANSICLRDAQGFKVFPVEGVFATIEVKSRLSKRKMQESSDNIRSIQSLLKTVVVGDKETGEILDVIPSGERIFSTVFSFSAEVSLDALGQTLKALRGIDYVCVLDRGNVCWVTKGSEEVVGEMWSAHVTSTPDYNEDRIALISGAGQDAAPPGYSLYFFLDLILEHIEKEHKKNVHIPLPKYFELPGGQGAVIRFLDRPILPTDPAQGKRTNALKTGRKRGAKP